MIDTIFRDYMFEMYDMVTVFDDTEVAYIVSLNTFTMRGKDREIEFRYVIAISYDGEDLWLTLYIVPVFTSWSGSELADMFHYFEFDDEQVKNFYAQIDTPNSYDYPIRCDSSYVINAYSLVFNEVDVNVNHSILEDRNAYGMVLGLINGDISRINNEVYSGNIADGSYAYSYGFDFNAEYWENEFDRVAKLICVDDKDKAYNVVNSILIRIRETGEVRNIGSVILGDKILDPDQFDIVTLNWKD